MKLANDGCATAHTSPETARVADWANWRDEVFGFTYEPAVFVYNNIKVPPGDVPRTHVELADLLREKLDTYRGRVGTYDIRLSGIGYLLAFNDARQTTAVFGRLLEGMARASAVARCCTGEILEEVAKGNLYIGYNMLGSYAYEAARRYPQLKVVVPRDYTLVLQSWCPDSERRETCRSCRKIFWIISSRSRGNRLQKTMRFTLPKPAACRPVLMARKT